LPKEKASLMQDRRGIRAAVFVELSFALRAGFVVVYARGRDVHEGNFALSQAPAGLRRCCGRRFCGCVAFPGGVREWSAIGYKSYSVSKTGKGIAFGTSGVGAIARKGIWAMVPKLWHRGVGFCAAAAALKTPSRIPPSSSEEEEEVT